VILWLWDAPGPRHTVRGVSDDEAAARQAAEACMLEVRARAARVEQAQVVLEATTLECVYRRTGSGWQARRDRAGITWKPIT
jgi:hypothetical protein